MLQKQAGDPVVFKDVDEEESLHSVEESVARH
jgi:hypothetical protein